MSQHPCAHRARNRGLTLIELMMGLVVLAVLAVIAVPSFRTQIAANDLNSAAQELMASLTRTRAESMRVGQRVTACRSGNSTSACSTSTSVGWESGWLVFQDPTRIPTATLATVNAGETVTSVVTPLPLAIKVVTKPAGSAYVSYAADGRPKLYSGAPHSDEVVLRVCSTSDALSDDNRARDIKLLPSGQLTMKKVTGVSPACPAPT